MTERTLKALPAEHQQLWRSVCRHVRQPLLDLARRGVDPSAILVIVAHRESHPAEVLEQHFRHHVVYGIDDPGSPVVAIFGTAADEDPSDGFDPFSGYLMDLPPNVFALLVFGSDGRPVISTCVMPPAAPGKKTRRGLNNLGTAS